MRWRWRWAEKALLELAPMIDPLLFNTAFSVKDVVK
jgi:hypothetical protein